MFTMFGFSFRVVCFFLLVVRSFGCFVGSARPQWRLPTLAVLFTLLPGQVFCVLLCFFLNCLAQKLDIAQGNRPVLARSGYVWEVVACLGNGWADKPDKTPWPSLCAFIRGNSVLFISRNLLKLSTHDGVSRAQGWPLALELSPEVGRWSWVCAQSLSTGLGSASKIWAGFWRPRTTPRPKTTSKRPFVDLF